MSSLLKKTNGLQSKNLLLINGHIERIIYFNPENDYTVLKILPEGDTQFFVGVGYLGGVQPGEDMQFEGQWVDSSKFGKQFKISRYRIIYPSTEKGITNFLSSGLIDGIGEKFAERIVSVFGKETLKVISETPERLREVKGLGEKKIERLLKSWKENYAVKDIMMFLQDYDISCAFASKIFRQYGFDSIKVVQENPYRLAMDISGIGFLSADKIAKSFGILTDSPKRIEAGIIYVTGQLMDQGNVYVPQNILIEETTKILGVDVNAVIPSLENLIRNRFLIRKQTKQHTEAIYLASLFLAENGISDHYERLKSHPSKTSFFDPEALFQNIENESDFQFSEDQRKAILLSMKSKTMVITGGPGTGKTTIIRTLVEIYSRNKLVLQLAAPTGRAAKRLQESTGVPAKTVHRLLEYNPKQNIFERNEDKPLEADAVIIDEASMLDLLLMFHLLSALPNHCIFLLVGDVDQLPSVGPGRVLHDIIESKVVPTVKLNTIFRQAEGSNIIENAHRINKGAPLILDNSLDGHFFFIEKESPPEILSIIQELVCDRIPSRFGLDPLKQIQVLTPMHKTDLGVHNLNEILQNKLNLMEKISVRRHLNVAAGDKIMQTANNYDKEIFNGDIGFVQEIDQNNQKVLIEFDNRVISFQYSDMEDMVLAYAITIHKSQGSEYDAVIIPVTTHHYTMLQRNLLYTAVTRGKKLVILIGTKKALNIAIKNIRTQNRYTDLKEKLSAQLSK